MDSESKLKHEYKIVKLALMIEFNQYGSGRQFDNITVSDKGELLEKFLTERKFKITRINHSLNKKPGEKYLDLIEKAFNEAYENATVISRLGGESVSEDSICLFVYVRCQGISNAQGEIEISDPNGYRFPIEKHIKLFAMIKNCATYIYLECPRNNPQNLPPSKKIMQQFNPLNAHGFLLLQYCFAKDQGWDVANDESRKAQLLKFIQALAANQISNFYQYVTSWQPESNFIGNIELSSILNQAIAPIDNDISVLKSKIPEIVHIPQSVVEELNKRILELEAETKTYYEQNLQMFDDLKEKDIAITQFEATIRELQEQADLEQMSSHSQHQVTALEEHIQTLKGVNSTLENNYQKLEKKYEKLVKKLNDKKDKLKRIEEDYRNQSLVFSQQLLQLQMSQMEQNQTPKAMPDGMNSNYNQNQSREMISPKNNHRDQRIAPKQLNNHLNSLYSDPFNVDESKFNDDEEEQDLLQKRQQEFFYSKQRYEEEEEKKAYAEEARIQHQRALKEKEEEELRKKKEELEEKRLFQLFKENKEREERLALEQARQEKERQERQKWEQEEIKQRLQKEKDERLRKEFEQEQLEKQRKIQEQELEVEREIEKQNQVKIAQNQAYAQNYGINQVNHYADESIDLGQANLFDVIKRKNLQQNDNQMNPQNERENIYGKQHNGNIQNYGDQSFDNDMEFARRLQEQEEEQERLDELMAQKLQQEYEEEEQRQKDLRNNPPQNRFEEHKQPFQRQEQAQVKPNYNINASSNQRIEMPMAKPQQQFQQINRNFDDEYVLPNSDIGFAVSNIVKSEDIDLIRGRIGKKFVFERIFKDDGGLENEQLIQAVEGKNNLLILVEAKRNNDHELIGRFGAFISIPYQRCNNEDEQFYIDPEAFIISLDKKKIFEQINAGDENVGFSSQSILILGKIKEGSKVPKIQSMDLFLRDSKGVKKSSSSLGSSFLLPPDIDKKIGAKFLTGLLIFTIDKIEVFQAQ